MCESFSDEWANIVRRHREFHDANRIVQVERLWAIDPTEYDQMKRAGEQVRRELGAPYSQRPVGQKVENVEPKGGEL